MLLNAVADAQRFHRGQVRKGSSIPYLCHPLGVGALVMEAGGTPSEVAAGILHDTAEDVQEPGMTGEDVLALIKEHYGDETAHIVRACSDTLPLADGAKKPAWRGRKERYIDHLQSCDASTLLVSSADKLNNLRATMADWREIGDTLFAKFNTGDGHTLEQRRTETLWYYRALYDVFTSPESAVDPRRARICREIGAILDTLEGASSTRVGGPKELRP
jgi:(p)ppGpp synthase/HD superfamily hydrolase